MYLCFVDKVGDRCAINLTIQPLAEIYELTEEDQPETELVFLGKDGNVLSWTVDGHRMNDLFQMLRTEVPTLELPPLEQNQSTLTA